VHSRRDQVEAHAFVKSRLRSALLRAEPDAPRPPLRRTPVALVIGMLLGGLAVAVVALLSLLKPGGGGVAWRKPGALIVERETGNRYVLSEGRLRPVLNYASARLLLADRMTVASTSAASLAGLPRGGPVGIVGAPDTLPPPRAADQPWLVCATPPHDADAVDQPGVTVLLGPSLPPSANPAGEAALVRTPDGTVYLAENGRRMRLTAPWVIRALGFDGSVPRPVRSSWADALPAGPDLGTLPVAGRGNPGPTLAGQATEVGQVLTASGPGTTERHYLMTSGGLMPVNDTATALALGDPATADAYDDGDARALPLSPTALASAPTVDTAQWAGDLPPVPTALATDHGDRVPCALVDTAGGTARTTVVTVAESVVGEAAAVDAPSLQRDNRTADQVAVAPRGGMLARTLPAPGVPGAGLYLVVDSGAKYPVDGDAAAAALGYSSAGAATVPAALLALLPTGPVLHLIQGGGA
jgi:type VII secretion protein EccB